MAVTHPINIPCPKNADTAKQLTVTQQTQEEVARIKEQLAFQMEQAKRESEMKVGLVATCTRSWRGKPRFLGPLKPYAAGHIRASFQSLTRLILVAGNV